MMRCTCEVARREARLEALEEAAKIAEMYFDSTDEDVAGQGINLASGWIAADIRALKEAK